MDYLIWSNEHRGWWRGSYGYTIDLTKAGRFTEEKAREICKRATMGWRRPSEPPPEIMVRWEDVEATLMPRWKQMMGVPE